MTHGAAPLPAASGARRNVRRPGTKRRVLVNHVDPWSVFRISAVLYFCLLLVVTLGLMIFWLILSRMPIMQSMLEAVERLGIPIDPGLILQVLVPVGVLNVVLWSGANLFFAILYNLISDLVGGLRVTVTDED